MLRQRYLKKDEMHERTAATVAATLAVTVAPEELVAVRWIGSWDHRNRLAQWIAQANNRAVGSKAAWMTSWHILQYKIEIIPLAPNAC